MELRFPYFLIFIRCHAHFARNLRESWTGNRTPVPADRVPAVAMIGWHVARLVGVNIGVNNQNGIDVQAISNLEISFPLLFKL